MKLESKLVGGPYNGNSFYIPEEDAEYRITSHTASYAIDHVYVRQDVYHFIYKGPDFINDSTQ